MFTIHDFNSTFSVKVYHVYGVNKHASFYCMLSGIPAAPIELSEEQFQSLKNYLKDNFPLHYNLAKGMKHD